MIKLLPVPERNPIKCSLIRQSRSTLRTGADCFLRSEAGLRVFRGDALDGRQGDIGVRAGQPRRLRLFGPALQVSGLQSIGPAPPTAHDSASGHLHFQLEAK